MFPRRYFTAGVFAPRYFPVGGAPTTAGFYLLRSVTNPSQYFVLRVV